MVKIYAPNRQYNGLSAGVMFVNGVGETDNPELIEWFEKHGYDVVKDVKPKRSKKDSDPNAAES